MVVADRRVGRSSLVSGLGGGRWWRCGILVVSLAIAGCGHNPALGKWNIGKREKETETSDIDELSHDIRTAADATTIEFRKDSIVISGGTANQTESNIDYSVAPLEGGATDIRILQPRKGDTSADIDTLHIAADGKTAQLESRTEVVDLTRAQN
ncbi:MAG: hypothetical protein ACYDC3_07815 [Candidatus Binataceae bacterium]